MKLRTATGLRDVKLSLRTASGLRAVGTIQLRTPTGLRTVYSASGGGSSSALTPDEVDGYGYSKTPVSITTPEATITVPSGATIVWNFTPSSGWTAANPNSGTSGFKRTVAAGVMEQTSVTATITQNGVSKTSNAITATVTNNYGA